MSTAAAEKNSKVKAPSQPVSDAQNSEIRSFSAFLVSCVIWLGIATNHLLSGSAIETADLNPYLVRLFEYYRQEPVNLAAGTKHAYLVTLVAVAALVSITPAITKPLHRLLAASGRKLKLAFDTVSLCTLLYLIHYSWQWNQHNLNHFATEAITGLLCCLALCFVWRDRLLNALSLALVGLALAVTVLPGFFCTYDFSSFEPERLIHSQLHYTAVLGAADRLGAGLDIFKTVMPYYGVLLPTVMGGWQRHLSAITLADYIQVIRWSQLLYLGGVAGLYCLYARGRFIFALLAFLTVAPWYHFYAFGMEFPNSAGLRIIGMPLAFAVLYLLRTAGFRKSAIATGALSAFLILLNVESGLVLTAGLGTYITFRYQLLDISKMKTWIQAAGLYLSGFCVVMLAFLGLYSLLFGDAFSIPDFVSFTLERLTTAGVLRGRAGLPDPIILLMFAHAAFVLVWTALTPRISCSFRASFRAAAAATLLVWLIYYIGRPSQFTLLSYFFLYGFLLIETYRTVATSARARSKLTGPLTVSLLAISCIVMPQSALSFHFCQPSYKNGIAFLKKGPSDAGAVGLSGVPFNKAIADELSLKSRHLKHAARKHRIAFLTANSFLIPKLSGVYNDLPFADTLANVFKESDRARLISLLRNGDYDELYFDAPASRTQGPHPYTAYYACIRSQLQSDFPTKRIESGWLIISRK